MALRVGSEGEALVRLLGESRAALTRSIIERDYGQYALRSCVASGLIARVLPGVYVHAQHASDAEVRVRAASAWIAPVGAVTGVAACWAWGVLARAPREVTLQVPPELHRVAPRWVRLTRPAVPMRFLDVKGVRSVAPASAVIQAWCEMRGDSAIGLVVDSVRTEFTTVGLVRAALASTPRVRARAALTELLDHMDRGVTSFLEHRAKTHVFPENVFPELTWQHPVRAAGRRRVLDAFAADVRIAIEFDGATHHSGDTARLADIQRDAELATIGILVLRLPYESVMKRPQWCRETYRAARAARLHGSFERA